MTLGALRASGVAEGDLVAVVVTRSTSNSASEATASLAAAGGAFASSVDISEVGALDVELKPRWVVWSQETTRQLDIGGVRVARCWDLSAVHCLGFGGWTADPAHVWAASLGLPLDDVPQFREPDLFHSPTSAGPLDGDYLNADWVAGRWAEDEPSQQTWARLALATAERQLAKFTDTDPRFRRTAFSESATEALCAELSVDGLPFDIDAAESVIAEFIGPRPNTAGHAAELRMQRDERVLRHVPDIGGIDLRSPGQVKSLLRRVGIETPDTRAWRLKALRDEHPVVGALLEWRKAERIATTYGYEWLDRHVEHGRLRGSWTGTDGAAGRMTASAGLHNMPSDLRRAVIADHGYVFIRSDLGQIEPRVLAAVSGDAALAQATQADDMYVPLAQQLGVDRATAKLAMLGAMYGQTTGNGAQALWRLQVGYPTAIAYLEAAAAAAQGGNDLLTYGGRRVLMRVADARLIGESELRRQAAARGRYGRNAMVQGAAAEFFKMWAVTVRSRGATIGAQIVLCLHDELLVHAPEHAAQEAVSLVEDSLQEAAFRWAPDNSVRFLADTSIVSRWSDAKD